LEVASGGASEVATGGNTGGVMIRGLDVVVTKELLIAEAKMDVRSVTDGERTPLTERVGMVLVVTAVCVVVTATATEMVAVTFTGAKPDRGGEILAGDAPASAAVGPACMTPGVGVTEGATWNATAMSCSRSLRTAATSGLTALISSTSAKILEAAQKILRTYRLLSCSAAAKARC
jgi:hypothetical protein